jgi:hypothetical protein
MRREKKIANFLRTGRYRGNANSQLPIFNQRLSAAKVRRTCRSTDDRKKDPVPRGTTEDMKGHKGWLTATLLFGPKTHTWKTGVSASLAGRGHWALHGRVLICRSNRQPVTVPRSGLFTALGWRYKLSGPFPKYRFSRETTDEKRPLSAHALRCCSLQRPCRRRPSLRTRSSTGRHRPSWLLAPPWP